MPGCPDAWIARMAKITWMAELDCPDARMAKIAQMPVAMAMAMAISRVDSTGCSCNARMERGALRWASFARIRRQAGFPPYYARMPGYMQMREFPDRKPVPGCPDTSSRMNAWILSIAQKHAKP